MVLTGVDISSINSEYGLELLHRATVEGDLAAQSALQQCLGEVVLGWLRGHPNRAVACRYKSEEKYVAQAFQLFWQATAGQQVTFETFAGALVYLRVSLQGAVLDTLRASSRPGEISLPVPAGLREPQGEDQRATSEVLQILQTILPGARERRLAYLLYHCGLKPKEIVQSCPQEWSDVQEIYRLRRSIIERMLPHAGGDCAVSISHLERLQRR